MKAELEVWRSGTGKVIAVGDIVYTDSTVRGSKGTYRYKVKAIRAFVIGGKDVVEVDVFGGRPPRMRTFTPTVLHRDRKAEMANRG